MTSEQKQSIIKTIVQREKLRPLRRWRRLLFDPVRAIPYYFLAALSRIKPYKISFKTLWGTKMSGFLPESNTFYYYGFCEANVTSFLLRFLKNGDTFIDVGAHIGFYSVLASELVLNKGSVYSFEPTLWTYKLLLANTANLANVYTINAGVSDANGETSFADYGHGYGAYNSASADGTILKFKPKQTTIKTAQLDKFCKENNIHPDFIKLDAEGLEYKILAGMKEILHSDRPFITLEMANDEKWSNNYDNSSAILFSNRYVSYEMTGDGYIKKCEIKPSYTYANILFIPEEKISAVTLLIQH